MHFVCKYPKFFSPRLGIFLFVLSTLSLLCTRQQRSPLIRTEALTGRESARWQASAHTCVRESVCGVEKGEKEE